jgi:hypothetical protein
MRVTERLQWFDGSALTERDLADAVAFESRMLELHVQGIHRTWGVAHGLTITLSNDAREVLVAPGFAYTCRGEALIVAELTRAALPGNAGAGTYDLLLVPPAPPEKEACERPVTCTGDAIVQRASLRWEPAASPSAAGPPLLGPAVRLGWEIPIARFRRLASGVLVGPDMSQRRVARGLVRPHVAFGVTRPNELSWQLGTAELSATVDTSGAGFSARPFYFATLGSAAWPAGVVGPFIALGQATASSFQVQVRFGRPGAPTSLEPLVGPVRSAPLSWVGVEPVLGCPPTITLLEFLALGLSQTAVAGNWSTALATLTRTQA